MPPGSKHGEHPPIGSDDVNGYYQAAKGEMLGGRYLYQDYIGHGTYSSVVGALDVKTSQQVAIKILRAQQIFRDFGAGEVATLERLGSSSYLSGSTSVIKLLGTFSYNGHLCIVLTRHGTSLFDIIRMNRGPFNVAWGKELSKSFMAGVAFLHRCNMAHCDIKSENILCYERPVASKVRERIFVHPPTPDLVLCDVGSVNRGPAAATRQYRAPEGLLGLGVFGKLRGDIDQELLQKVMYAADIWSCGCVIYEIFFGKILFPTFSTSAHLALMSKVIGPVDDKTHRRIIATATAIAALQSSSSMPAATGSTSDAPSPSTSIEKKINNFGNLNISQRNLARYLSLYNVENRTFNTPPGMSEVDTLAYENVQSLTSYSSRRRGSYLSSSINDNISSDMHMSGNSGAENVIRSSYSSTNIFSHSVGSTDIFGRDRNSNDYSMARKDYVSTNSNGANDSQGSSVLTQNCTMSMSGSCSDQRRKRTSKESKGLELVADLLLQMLRWDPLSRLRARDVLKHPLFTGEKDMKEAEVQTDKEIESTYTTTTTITTGITDSSSVSSLMNENIQLKKEIEQLKRKVEELRAAKK